MKLSVIGAGNTGKVMSAHLSSMGYDVILYDRNKEKVDILNKDGIELYGAIETHQYVKVTNSLEEAIESSKIIFVMTTANGHRDLAAKMKNYLKQNQIIVIFNGNWGAYEFYKELNNDIFEKNLVISETGSMIYIAASDSINKVKVKQVKENISLSCIPQNKCNEIVKTINEIYPEINGAKNIVQTSINNSNPIIHVPIMMYNFSKVKNGEDFLFYTDGATKEAIEYIEKIDEERRLICEAFEIEFNSVLDIINSFWPDKHNNLYDAIHLNNSYKTIIGPKSLNHRYITEDILYGIAPLYTLGKQLGLNTTYLDKLIEFFTYELNTSFDINYISVDDIHNLIN